VFDQQRQDVLNKLKGEKALIHKKDLNDLWDSTAYDATLATAVTPVYRSLVAEAGQQAMSMVASQVFDSTAQSIAAYFTDRSGLISKAINAETDKQLRATLTEGINAGESIPQLADRITSVFGSLAGYRSERIARTETTAATTFATNTAWQQSGVVEGKEWFTAHDERVCPGCEVMDGSIIGIEKAWFNKGDVIELTDETDNVIYRQKVDFDAISGPPLHVQCRCTELPVMI
jgi:SPP1 gp7 family putative phage head morphogenesis protein